MPCAPFCGNSVTTKCSVLIVDDERDNCANLQDILVCYGHRADVAYDAEHAMRLVSQYPYDVAVLDLQMPGMNGVELFRRIKQLRSSTKAIIVTAYASSEVARQAEEAGARTILSKPLDLCELLALIS